MITNKYAKGIFLLKGREENFKVEGLLTSIYLNNKEYKIILNKNNNQWNASEYYTGLTFGALNTSSKAKIIEEVENKLKNSNGFIDNLITTALKEKTNINE